MTSNDTNNIVIESFMGFIHDNNGFSVVCIISHKDTSHTPNNPIVATTDLYNLINISHTDSISKPTVESH